MALSDRDSVRPASVRASEKKAKRRATGGIAGASVSVARRQTTPKQVVRRSSRAGSRAPQGPPPSAESAQDEFLRAFNEAAGIRSGKQPARREVQTGGPNLDRLALLDNNTNATWLGGLVRNTARGALDTLTGLPAAAQLLGENLVAFNPAVTPARLAHEAGVPGLGWTESYQNRVMDMDKRAGRGVAESYAYKYGPAFRGDFGTTGRRIYDDPFGTALDVSGAYGVAGRAGNVASKAARFAAPTSRAAAAASRRLSIAPAVERQAWVDAENAARVASGKKPLPFQPGPGVRNRPPKRYVSQANAKGGRTAEAEAVVERGPYSANKITRGVQRLIDRGAERRQARIDERAARDASGTPVVGPVRNLRTRLAQGRTSEARFQRAQGKAAKEIRYMSERRAEAMVGSTPEYRQFVQATRKLQKDKTPAGISSKGLGREELAVSLHLDDLVAPRAGMSSAALRDRAVANWEKELAKFEKDHGPQPNARLQIERIKEIPEEYLTLAGDSPAVLRIKTAVQAGRDLDRVNQNRSVAAGVITKETAQAIKSRPSSVILGGAEWLPSKLRSLKDAGVGRTERRAVVQQDFRNNPPPGWKKAKEELAQAEMRLAEAQSKVREGVTPRREFFSRDEVDELSTARTARDKAKARLRRIEEKGKKRITQPKRPELTSNKAVYRPARSSEGREARSPFATGRGMSGPGKVKQSHGTRQRTGTYDMNPSLLAHQARRAAGDVTGPMSNRALNELVDTAAYKVDGELARGKRAYQVMANDPDKVVLVNTASLKKAMAKLDRLEEGKYLEDVDVRMFYGEPGKGQDWLQPLQDSKGVTNDYVAISRGAAEAWRESMAAPWKWLEKYDNALDLWKGGLLALSPRWYITNVVGLAFQYGLVAGGDVRSIWRAARSPEIKRAIAEKNPDVAVATLADELTSGLQAGKIENAGALMTTIRGGFKINNKIEAMWRRAAYLNRAKKMLRDEGGKFRGMSDKELAAAIDRMPESVARQIVSDVDFYIGEYGRYNTFERQFIKRVVPFYSWLRVIGRLTLKLPFKSPVRALALAVLAKAGTAGINPNDYQLPAYARGSFSFGNVKVPTWSLNPYQTVVPFLEGVGEGNAFGGVAKAGVGWATPIAQLGLNQGFGLNNFGEGVFAPPGAGGTVQQFGRDPQEMNPVTGLPQDAKIRIPWSEAFIQTAIPGIAGPLRRALVGEETAYDTTTLQDLLGLTNKPRGEMFYQRSGPRARQPTPLNSLTSYFGIPSYRQDDRIVDRQYRDRLKDFEKSARQTERRKRKASR